MATTDIFLRAAALGIDPPIFTQAERPSLWEWWKGRVLIAENRARHGVDITPIVREAALFGGHMVEPTATESSFPLLDLELFRQLRSCIVAAGDRDVR